MAGLLNRTRADATGAMLYDHALGINSLLHDIRLRQIVEITQRFNAWKMALYDLMEHFKTLGPITDDMHSYINAIVLDLSKFTNRFTIETVYDILKNFPLIDKPHYA